MATARAVIGSNPESTYDNFIAVQDECGIRYFHMSSTDLAAIRAMFEDEAQGARWRRFLQVPPSFEHERAQAEWARRRFWLPRAIRRLLGGGAK